MEAIDRGIPSESVTLLVRVADHVLQQLIFALVFKRCVTIVIRGIHVYRALFRDDGLISLSGVQSCGSVLLLHVIRLCDAGV